MIETPIESTLSLRLHVPSRLEGIETGIRIDIDTHFNFRLHVPSRLGGN